MIIKPDVLLCRVCLTETDTDRALTKSTCEGRFLSFRCPHCGGVCDALLPEEPKPRRGATSTPYHPVREAHHVR